MATMGHEIRVELDQLFDETVSLYHRLTAAATTIHRKGALSGPRRTVLIALARSGPQTVAHLARQRSQSRQRLQPLVNALVEEGLLQTLPNAMHRQSPLVAVTAKGERAVAEMRKREVTLRSGLRIASSGASVQRAAKVLRDVRVAIETQLDDLVASRSTSRRRYRPSAPRVENARGGAPRRHGA
jgi:DNA-binding MarR family transcriptional regulator